MHYQLRLQRALVPDRSVLGLRVVKTFVEPLLFLPPAVALLGASAAQARAEAVLAAEVVEVHVDCGVVVVDHANVLSFAYFGLWAIFVKIKLLRLRFGLLHVLRHGRLNVEHLV